jgi:demethylmenaquinone methyltransferase/2-methoxy-6-polyprenyl-1,4-benzoquinol methylase
VLEVGCATGALTSYLVDSGHTVIGLDSSDDMIDRARIDHPGVDMVVGNAMSLPYDTNTFDAVVAASVINVVPAPAEVLAEMQRVTAPGGTVSVLVPAASFVDKDLDSLIETLGVTGFSRAALAKWHQGPTKMGATRLEALFQDAGLEPVATRRYLEGMLLVVTATRASA